MRRLVSLLCFTLVGVALMVIALDGVGRVRAQAPPQPQQASPHVGAQGITASGSALIAPNVDITTTPLVMTLSLTGNGSEAASAVSELQKQAQTITIALQAVGIPSSAIQLTNLSLSSQRLPPYPAPTSPSATAMPTSSPGATPSPPGTPRLNYIANGLLRIRVTGLDQLTLATSAIANTGLTTLYQAINSPSSQPSAESLATAVDQAMQQARDMATRAAGRAGLALGGVRAVEIKSPLSQPTPASSYNGDPGGWRLDVVVTYDVTTK